MKKSARTGAAGLTLLIVVFLLSACLPLDKLTQTSGTDPAGQPTALPSTPESSGAEDPTASSVKAEYFLTDYFPLTANLYRDYDGTGNEYVPMKVWVDYQGPDFIQLSEDNGGTQVHRLYRIRDGQVLRVVSLAELYAREDLRLRPESPAPEVMLQEPLEVGTTWLVEGRQRSISALDVQITTPAGTFSALEVSTQGDGIVTRHYYAPGVGLIRMTISGDYEIDQWLKSLKENEILKVPLALYYGRLTQTDSEIVSQTVTVPFPTNTGLKEVLAHAFREPLVADMPRLISDNTVINWTQYDPQTGIATIDFSQHFVSEMNAGSSFEAVIISCVVNTVGHAYGVEKVMISLDGRPYESGHIALGPGEFFGVNDDGVKILP